MTFMAKLGWSALGLLVALCLALMFWINLIMGATFTVFCAVVFWFVLGVQKKKMDVLIKAGGESLGLQYKSHPFRHGSISGEFKNHQVRISYEGSRTIGLGTALALAGEAPGWAALDIRTVTLIRMDHDLDLEKKKLIDGGQTLITAHKSDVRLYHPDVVTDAGKLNSSLKRLAGEIDNLKG